MIQTSKISQPSQYSGINISNLGNNATINITPFTNLLALDVSSANNNISSTIQENIDNELTALLDPIVMNKVNVILEGAKNYLLGLSSINMHKIIMKLNNLTSEEVADQGRLISIAINLLVSLLLD